ncbi:MAG: hypothetical protein WC330_05320 [Candidatus Omnitrophota bacterium]|jgi:hypothetical protein
MPVSLLTLILFVILVTPIVIILILQSGNPFREEKNTSKSHLKKNETLDVNIKNGRWWCPSCGDSNLEAKEDCGSCGQKVKKA